MDEPLGDVTKKELVDLYKIMKEEGHVPKESAGHLEELMKQFQAGTEDKSKTDGRGIVVTPDAGFVVKTADKAGKKVFINVCTSDKMLLPSNWGNDQMTPENQAFLDKLAKDGRVGPDEEAARFPMAVGPLREDKDHLGEPASVCDIIMNPTIIRQAHDFRPLKHFIVMLLVDMVNNRFGIKVDKRYKLPKMRYKGDKPIQQVLRKAAPSLIKEIDPADREATFPLRAGKPSKKGQTSSAKQPHSQSRASKASESSPAAKQSDKGPTKASVGSSGMPPEIAAALGRGTSDGQEIHLDIRENGEVMGVRPTTNGTSAQEPEQASADTPGPSQSSSPDQLTAKVSYDGRPVTFMHVTVDLPSSLGWSEGNDISVECSNHERKLYIAVPGHASLVISLPFMVLAEHATASLQPAIPASSRSAEGPAQDQQQLKLDLPIKPCLDILREARVQSGTGTLFDKYNLSNTSYMELEP